MSEARRMFPKHVMDAINVPDCEECGQPVQQGGATVHVICQMIRDERARDE